MKSLGKTVEAAKGSVSEYKGWIILGLFGFGLYKFNSAFGSLGDTLKLKIDAATAEGKARAEAEAAEAKVKAQAQINKARVSVLAPGATPAEVAQYAADAEAIAGHLGTKKSVWTRQTFFSNAGAAYSLLKTKYSRLLLHNNKPYNRVTLTAESVETKYSAKRKVNASVLQPFYDELTGGRNLVADVKDSCTGSKYPLLKWIL